MPPLACDACQPCAEALRSRSARQVEYGQIMHLTQNAQQAAQQRAEKEERKRFAEEQKEKMRNRGKVLRQRDRDHRDMEAVRRAASKKTPTTVVSLSNMTSAERAAVAKALWSPVLCGENDHFEAPREYYGC